MADDTTLREAVAKAAKELGYETAGFSYEPPRFEGDRPVFGFKFRKGKDNDNG